MKRLLVPTLLFAALTASAARGDERTLDLGNGQKLAYSIIDSASPLRSAQDVARQILSHLAAGRLDEAAGFSNAPPRRYEVLRDYESSVGEAEFKRVFGQYLNSPVVAEFAIGAHRLIVWDLAAATHHLAGQYYVEVEGRFLMDDVPGPVRADLRRVLQDFRKTVTPSGRKD